MSANVNGPAEDTPTEQFVAQATRSVLDALGIDAQIVVRKRPKGAREPVVVELVPAERSPLDARRWTQASQALSLLLEAALVARREDVPVSVLLPEPAPGARPGSVVVDGLESAVRELAERAAARGLSFAIGPMAVGDRRLVHQALGEVEGVWTHSVGEGIFRRLWVMPKQDAASEDGEEPKARNSNAGETHDASGASPRADGLHSGHAHSGPAQSGHRQSNPKSDDD